MQALEINAKVVCPDMKIIISLNLGLYISVSHLQKTQKDMNYLVTSADELFGTARLLKISDCTEGNHSIFQEKQIHI